MAGVGGLSVATNLLANDASLNLNSNQAQLGKAVTRLSSGLRINNSSDDPSGLTIAQNLQTQVGGYDQGSRNVQDANNAVTVASGALATVKDILQRIRQLAIEGSSDILSDEDRVSLQDETSQLLLEINRIAENTNFNGTPLLNGAFSGYQAAQQPQAIIESNATLNTAGSIPDSGQLITMAAVGDGPATQQPQFDVPIESAALGTGEPETVSVIGDDAQYLQPGMILSAGNAQIQIDTVDVTNGTITATFSAPVAAGSVMHSYVWGTSTNAVAAGESVMTLASSVGDAGLPLYAGEVLQIDPGGVNDVVKVQAVLSPTSFLADFNDAHAAGVQVFSFNGNFISDAAPEVVTIPFGPSTDPPPAGSEAWVEESTSFFPGNNGAEIVGTGTVNSATSTNEYITIPQITDAFGGLFTVWTALGSETAGDLVVPPNDGTVQLQVVNDNGTIGVQETYYDTASQTTQTSPILIPANTRGMLFNGTTFMVGNITAADVGLSGYIKVLQATPMVSGQTNPTLTIQSGPAQGTAIQLGIAAMNAGMLRLSNTNLMSSLSSEDAIGQVDYALGQVLTVDAQLGATMVQLNQETDNNNIASVNLANSESNITDLNVPQETSDYTRLQILGQIGTSVLAQANTNAESILALFR